MPSSSAVLSSRLTPPVRIPRGSQRTTRVLESLAYVAECYAAALCDPVVGLTAQTYLAGRGYSDLAWLTKYGVGFAPGYGMAARWRTQCGVGPESDADLVTAGVLFEATTERPTPGEFLRGRVTFAIGAPGQSIMGKGRGGTWHPVAFGGRSLGADEPKYLNTRETPVYSKGQTLYGLEWAVKAIRASHTVILVEGFLDVLRCHQHGHANVVAPLGTALTEAQIALVHAGVPAGEPVDWVFCLDDDRAGINAVLRGAELVFAALRPGSTVRVMRLPGGKDPDAVLGQAVAAGDDAAALWAESLAAARPVLHAIVDGPADAAPWGTSLDGLVASLRRAQRAITAAPPPMRHALALDVCTRLRQERFSPGVTRLSTTLMAPRTAGAV